MLRSDESRLLLLEGYAIQSDQEFDALTAGTVGRYAASLMDVKPFSKAGFHSACDFGKSNAETRSWIFQTREGGQRVLQIDSVSAPSKTAKIRYKLVQNTSVQPAAPPSVSTLNLSVPSPPPAASKKPAFGQAVETVLPFFIPCLNHHLHFRARKIFTIGRGPATCRSIFLNEGQFAQC